MERSDLELVVAVLAHGSLAAARSLSLAAPIVTKRLAAPEVRLGQRLFQRTTRRVSPTAEGETLCARSGVAAEFCGPGKPSCSSTARRPVWKTFVAMPA